MKKTYNFFLMSLAYQQILLLKNPESGITPLHQYFSGPNHQGLHSGPPTSLPSFSLSSSLLPQQECSPYTAISIIKTTTKQLVTPIFNLPVASHHTWNKIQKFTRVYKGPYLIRFGYILGFFSITAILTVPQFTIPQMS